jgi:hypothetical protein
MSALLEIWRTIHAVVAASDYYTLGAAILIIIISGFLMESLRTVIPVTLAALLAFALVKFILAMTVGNQHDVEILASTDWRFFADMKALLLLAYALIFGVLIAAVNLIRSIVR